MRVNWPSFSSTFCLSYLFSLLQRGDCTLKICLINPPVREWAAPNCFPLGLGYLVSVMRQHEVEVLDINAYRFNKTQVETHIQHSSAEVFGIGGLITTYSYIKWLCEIVKKYHPNSYLVVGGAVSSVATLIPADCVVIGEGENAFDYVVRNQIKGIYQSTHTLNLSLLPFPAWNFFPMEIYLKNPIGIINKQKWSGGGSEAPLSMNISATRGCPYQCTYCYHDFMGTKYRTRPAVSVFEEMVCLFRDYGVEFIHFIDDEFCISKKFVLELCDLLIRSRLNRAIKWGCTGRVNLADRELYEAMKKAGCVNICYGVESGSQKMLDIMQKGVKVSQAIEALRMTKDIFGVNDFTLMIGMPGETHDTLGETLAFLDEVGEKPEMVFFATPYPGTQLYKEVRHKIPDEVVYIESLSEQGQKIALNCSDLPDETLIEWQKKLMAV